MLYLSQNRKQWAGLLFLPLLLVALSGCACAGKPPVHVNRQFSFTNDTFAFANELVWDYSFDANGHWSSKRHEPKPDYTLHCLVLARSTRQFFDNARFAPELPKADEATYRRAIRCVVGANPRHPLPEADKIVIPGYANLREFSVAQEKLLKQNCGSGWESYFARGNWRMVFPFTHKQQAHVAEHLLEHLRPDHPLVVHLSRFPSLSINHTVMIFGAEPEEKQIRFDIYDPNEPSHPTQLTFDRASRTFLFPSNRYFYGGRVDVYEMFHRWDY